MKTASKSRLVFTIVLIFDLGAVAGEFLSRSSTRLEQVLLPVSYWTSWIVFSTPRWRPPKRWDELIIGYLEYFVPLSGSAAMR
jgi:hypothetical protein